MFRGSVWVRRVAAPLVFYIFVSEKIRLSFAVTTLVMPLLLSVVVMLTLPLVSP